ncbi:MAG: hypothetical protein JO164_02590, partial [Candidatus Eremiobacteraeota bacterium]|nr:hypothetical protein [Candidatus Eremiobacteraeota bacterium]
MLARLGTPPVRLAVATLALAGLLAVPLHLSADPWAYAAYGALVTHGADPWAHAYRAADLARFDDPLLTAALRAWDGSLPRDVYGPLFALPCALVVSATRPFGPGGTVLALRVLAAAGLLACITLAGRRRPQLAALLAFHPVVLWSAAEGHNDVFWLALVLAADRVRGDAGRFATLIAAAAMKAVALVPLAAALARLPSRRRVVAAALAALALALMYAPLVWSVLAHGFDHGIGPSRLSLIHAPALATWSGSLVPVLIAVPLALAGLAAVVRALRGGDRLAGSALAGWLLLPAPEPWYALWLVPLVAVAGRTPAARALLAASVTGLAAYVQDAASGTAFRDPALLGGTMLALYAIPVVLALAQPAPSPQPNPLPATAPPLASPTAYPTPVSTPTPVPPSATPTPSPPPSPAPSATPNLFTYVVDPSPGPSGAPRIMEIALNDRVMHRGGMLMVKVTTSPDVTTVTARTL